MNTEIWKPIAGFEGSYEVSSLGRVRSLDRSVEMLSRWGAPVVKTFRGRVLKQQAFPNGYMNVMLPDGRRHLVHRLVAQAFVAGFDPELQVNHRDGVRSHNMPGNLEWVTCSANHVHAHSLPRRKAHGLRTSVAMALPEGPAVFESIKAAVRHIREAYGISVVAGSVASAMNRAHLVAGLPAWRA